jgi:hypothetical protein
MNEKSILQRVARPVQASIGAAVLIAGLAVGTSASAAPVDDLLASEQATLDSTGLAGQIALVSGEATSGSQYLGVVTVKAAVAKYITQISVVVEGASVGDLTYSWERNGVSSPITPLRLITPVGGVLPEGRLTDAFKTPSTPGEYVLRVSTPGGAEVRVPVHVS